MIIDIHTHTFPQKIAQRALEKLSDASGTAPYLDGTDAALRVSMRSAGIDWSVVLPVATNPDKCGHINEASAQENGRDGLLFFGAMHPDHASWRAELDHISALGLRGLKLHPVYQGADFDDPRNLRILERAGELGLTVITHAGDDIGFPGTVHCSPEMVANALRQVGPVRLILAHMGGWRNWDRVEALLAQSSVYLDTSFSTGRIPTRLDGRFRGKPLELLDNDAFLRMVRLFGAERILFGTDSPWSDQKQSLTWLRSLPLTEEEKAAILGGNAARLLGLTG